MWRGRPCCVGIRSRGSGACAAWWRPAGSRAPTTLDTCCELLDEARAILPDDIYRAEAIRTQGSAALMAARSGDFDLARRAALATLEASRGLMPTTFYSFEGYAGALETLVGLEVRMPHDHAIRRARRRAWWALAGFARVFPIAGPRFALESGLLRLRRGHQKSARRRWRRGLKRARALGLPLEELRLLHALGDGR